MHQHDAAKEAPTNFKDAEPLATLGDLMEALYWLVLCGPAALGVVALWCEYKRGA